MSRKFPVDVPTTRGYNGRVYDVTCRNLYEQGRN